MLIGLSANFRFGSTIMQFKLNNTKLHLFLCLPLFLTLSGCAGFGSAAYSSGTTAGTVFDADTNQPIADAIVVTSWEGTRSFLQSYTNCYHVETARTDANGNYKMAAWALPPLNEFPLITNKTDYTEAFKAGFIDVPLGKKYPDNEKGAWGRGAKVYLVKFTGTNDEYFEYLRKFVLVK